MPSRTEHRCRSFAGLAALVAFLLLASVPAEAAQSSSLTEEQVAAARDELKADPNLAAERSMRVLRWKDSDKPAPTRRPPNWIKGLLIWIAQTGRVIVWLTVGVLAALLVVFVIRFVRARAPRTSTRRFEAPTHVRDLDIRPESLPDDVGAAAFELWERREHRAALSLLYRGLLSRLAHVHEAPIRQSTTEGDCIELATRHLRSEPADYASRLVRVWQLAVYGNHEPMTDAMRELCAGFRAALTPEPPAAGASGS